jgi:hypothetical protein
MKTWRYRGHVCARCSATNTTGAPFKVLFRAFKGGKEVAKAFFKRDLEDAIDRICDGLTVGGVSVTTATQTGTGASARSEERTDTAMNFGS